MSILKRLIGSAPSQISRNKDLGTMAFQDTSQYYNTGLPVTFRNKIINGDMRIDQRNNGGTVSVSTAQSTGYGIDRWSCWMANWTGGSATVSQTTDTPAGTGLTHSFYTTVTSSSSSPDPSSGRYLVHQKIEGYNAADLKWGTSSAKPATLSFWVKCSVIGDFAISITNSDGNRGYVATYTVNSASTWEYKTITFPGDTTGTWLTNNGAGLILNFDLGVVGPTTSTYNTWLAGDYRGGLTTKKLMYTNGATWQLTGVQLERGDRATAFEHRHYGAELSLCKRYAHVIGNGNVAAGIFSVAGVNRSANATWFSIPLPVPMRATPSFSVTNDGTVRISCKTVMVNSAANSTIVGGAAPDFTYDASTDGTLNISYQNVSGTSPSQNSIDTCMQFSYGRFIFSAEL